MTYNGAGWGPWKECMAVFKQDTQLICGQELRLRGDAAKGAVMAAKAEGWKVALAEAVSAQAPGEKEDANHTSVGAGVAVREDRGIALLQGETEWEQSPPGQGGKRFLQEQEPRKASLQVG